MVYGKKIDERGISIYDFGFTIFCENTEGVTAYSQKNIE
jgi:hypothetical protein